MSTTSIRHPRDGTASPFGPSGRPVLACLAGHKAWAVPNFGKPARFPPRLLQAPPPLSVAARHSGPGSTQGSVTHPTVVLTRQAATAERPRETAAPRDTPVWLNCPRPPPEPYSGAVDVAASAALRSPQAAATFSPRSRYPEPAWPPTSASRKDCPRSPRPLVATYTECSRINHLGHKPLPSREAIVDILADLLDILYPGYGRRQNLHIGNVEYHVGDLIDGLHDKLTQQIARALRHELAADEAPAHRLRGAGPAEDDRAAPPAARAAQGARAGRAGRLRGRPGGQEPPRDHLLLPGPGGDHDLPRRPRTAAARRAADPAHDDRARPLEDRHRHPPRRDASGRASSSTTAPASSSARRATSAATSSSTRA